MIVMKKGILPEDIILEGECTYCHCIIRAVAKECRTNYKGKFFECPTKGCHNTIKMHEKVKPDLITHG